jgi:cell division protein FtsL
MTGGKSRGLGRKIFILGLVFLFLVLFMTSFFGKKGLVEIYKARKTHAELVREIEKLKQEKSRLEKEISDLEKDPRAVEKEARDKLWLVKPDEKVVVKKSK